jgi:hypothetical protein
MIRTGPIALFGAGWRVAANFSSWFRKWSREVLSSIRGGKRGFCGASDDSAIANRAPIIRVQVEYRDVIVTAITERALTLPSMRAGKAAAERIVAALMDGPADKFGLRPRPAGAGRQCGMKQQSVRSGASPVRQYALSS